MNIHWKELGERANPRHWTGFGWSVALLVLLCAIGTGIVGVKLYQVTDHPVGFNTH